VIKRVIIKTTVTAIANINEDAQGNQEIEDIEEIRDILEYEIMEIL